MSLCPSIALLLHLVPNNDRVRSCRDLVDRSLSSSKKHFLLPPPSYPPPFPHIKQINKKTSAQAGREHHKYSSILYVKDKDLTYHKWLRSSSEQSIHASYLNDTIALSNCLCFRFFDRTFFLLYLLLAFHDFHLDVRIRTQAESGLTIC